MVPRSSPPPAVSALWPGLVAFVISMLSASRPAAAVCRVLGPPTESVTPTHLRVAVSPSAEQLSYWFALRIHSEAERVALIVPLPRDSRVDPVSDAWFEALEAATAPRILAPASVQPPQCSTSSARQEDTALPAMQSSPAAEVAVLSSVSALRSFAAAHGLALGSADEGALTSATPAAYLALVYLPAHSEFWTETVRVTAPAPSRSFDFTIALGASEELSATLWAFGSGRGTWAPSNELEASDLRTSWLWASAKSDFVETRRRALSTAGDALLLEAASSSALFDAAPSVIAEYFARAESSGLLTAGAAACTERARRTRSAPPDDRFGTACARGELASLLPASAAPCTEAPSAAVIAPSELRCDGADDLALALSGLSPLESTVTRHTALLRPGSPRALTPGFGASASVSSVLPTRAESTAGCTPVSGGGGAPGVSGLPVEGAGGSAGFGGWAGYGGSASRQGPEPAPVATTSDECSSSGAVGVSCSGDSSGSSSKDDSCSGDSSGSSSKDDSCSGDSSSSSSKDDSCSGDSSKSSGNDSSYNGDTCSGDDSSSYNGDSCSGGSSSGGDDCSIRRKAPLRPRFSVVVLGLLAFCLPLRRAKRPKITRNAGHERRGPAGPLRTRRGGRTRL